MPCRVLDLSLEGVSLLPEEHCELKKGAEVTLRVMVPNLLHNTLIPLETKATHVVTTGTRGSQICRFSIPVEPQSQALISRYIFQRQVEIIRELKDQK
jgi:c-di-GMP-binding flagellar brake protein YcgR